MERAQQPNSAQPHMQKDQSIKDTPSVGPESRGYGRGRSSPSFAEIQTVEIIESVKASVRTAAKRLALAAHNASFPFAHEAAVAAPVVAAMLNALEPDWRRNGEWATFAAAIDFYAQFADAARDLREALQATSGLP